MIYVYDGDNWRHEVVLEQIILVNDVVKMPLCFGGERRCPPEDVGGVHGYQEVLEAIFDPSTKTTNSSSVGRAVTSSMSST